MGRSQAIKSAPEGNSQVATREEPRSLNIAQSGIRTATDFAQMMSALMSDLIDGRVAPNVGNATCNAGGKLLRVVELQYKYGTASPGKPQKTLVLAVGDGE